MALSKQKQDALQNSVYVLKNTLLDYSNRIAKRDKKATSVIETLYNSMIQMSKKSNNGKDTQEMRKAFSSVPLRLHSQAFRSFVISFYISQHIESSNVEIIPEIKEIEQELMSTVDEFFLETGKVLSPFEAVYLVLEALLQKNNLKVSKFHKQAEILVGDMRAQRRILEDFLNSYDKNYLLKIKAEETIDD